MSIIDMVKFAGRWYLPLFGVHSVRVTVCGFGNDTRFFWLAFCVKRQTVQMSRSQGSDWEHDADNPEIQEHGSSTNPRRTRCGRRFLFAWCQPADSKFHRHGFDGPSFGRGRSSSRTVSQTTGDRMAGPGTSSLATTLPDSSSCRTSVRRRRRDQLQLQWTRASRLDHDDPRFVRTRARFGSAS